MFKLRLRFPLAAIDLYADAYWNVASRPIDQARETTIMDEIAPAIRQQRYLTQAQLAALSYWKSPRSKTYAARNDDAFVQAVTHTALTTDHDRLRIEVLLLLAGVKWPTATVILHFGYDNLYPILDVRALWSVGVDKPESIPHTYAVWQEYTTFCRATAQAADVTLRKLDRALWQYAKENQP